MTANVVFASDARYVTSVWDKNSDTEERQKDPQQEDLNSGIATARFFSGSESSNTHSVESQVTRDGESVTKLALFTGFISQVLPRFTTAGMLIQRWYANSTKM